MIILFLIPLESPQLDTAYDWPKKLSKSVFALKWRAGSKQFLSGLFFFPNISLLSGVVLLQVQDI